MPNHWLNDWWWAFVLTQAVEGPLYARWLWGLGARRVLPTLGLALGASALTHPVVWFVIPPLVYGGTWEPGNGLGYGSMIALAETFAVGAEASYWRAVLRRLEVSWAHALGASLAVNGGSVLAGSLTRWLFDWP